MSELQILGPVKRIIEIASLGLLLAVYLCGCGTKPKVAPQADLIPRQVAVKVVGLDTNINLDTQQLTITLVITSSEASSIGVRLPTWLGASALHVTKSGLIPAAHLADAVRAPYSGHLLSSQSLRHGQSLGVLIAFSVNCKSYNTATAGSIILHLERNGQALAVPVQNSLSPTQQPWIMTLPPQLCGTPD